jgi:hypothetical protein
MKLAHLIKLKGRTILCAADSNNIEPRLYGHIHRLIGEVDIFFIGMECDGGPLSWLYGPLLTKPLSRKHDHSRRLNGSDCRKGMGIVERLRPRQVYVYAMGQEPWLTFLTSILYTAESPPHRRVGQPRLRVPPTRNHFGAPVRPQRDCALIVAD